MTTQLKPLIVFFLCCLFPLAHGRISVLSPSYVDEGAGHLTVTVSNYVSSTAGVWNFSYATTDGTAKAGLDYTMVSRVDLEVSSSTSSVDIVLNITDDNVVEDTEEFLLILSQGDLDVNVTVIIVDNDRVTFHVDYGSNIREGSHKEIYLYIFTTRPQIQTELKLFINTMDVTATAGEDYVPIANRLVIFPAWENRLTLTATILDDTLMEPSESFIITVNNNKLTKNLTLPVNIEDDDRKYTEDIFEVKILYMTTSTEEQDNPVNSHCERLGQQCLNGGSCGGDICWCLGSYVGPNCAIHIDDIQEGPGCDSLHCAHGTCVSNGTLARCACDRNYTGDLCDKAIYFNQCNSDNISICITLPHPAFLYTVRDIYVNGHRNTSECHLALAPSPPDPSDGIVDWCEGYAGVFRYNTSCVEVESITEDGLTANVLRMTIKADIIWYMRDVAENVTFRCTDNSVTSTYLTIHKRICFPGKSLANQHSRDGPVKLWSGQTYQLDPAMFD